MNRTLVLISAIAMSLSSAATAATLSQSFTGRVIERGGSSLNGPEGFDQDVVELRSSDPVSVDQFDPAQGTLNEVTLRFSIFDIENGGATITPNDAVCNGVPDTCDIRVSADFGINFGLDLDGVETGLPVGTGSITPDVGFQGGSGFPLDPFNFETSTPSFPTFFDPRSRSLPIPTVPSIIDASPVPGVFEVVLSADLDPFVGTGSLTGQVFFAADIISSLNCSTGLLTNTCLATSVTEVVLEYRADVIYDFDEAVTGPVDIVPLPASGVLLLFGLGGMVWVRARRD